MISNAIRGIFQISETRVAQPKTEYQSLENTLKRKLSRKYRDRPIRPKMRH